jgi:hypothetical protein
VISKWKFLIIKIENLFRLKIFSNFGHKNPGSGSGSALTKNAGSGSVSGSALKPIRIRKTALEFSYCELFAFTSTVPICFINIKNSVNISGAAAEGVGGNQPPVR